MTTYNVNKNEALSSKSNREFLTDMLNKGVLGIGNYGDNVSRAFNSAPMITQANINANLGTFAYLDPETVETLLLPLAADKIVKPKQKGNWSTESIITQLEEGYSPISPDDGSANDTIKTTYNVSRIIRGTKRFAGYWGVNDVEMEKYSQEKIDIRAKTSKMLMTGLNINRNSIFFKGVPETFGSQLPVYGLLNDPNLNPYNIVKTNAGGTSTYWKDKTANEIANDVVFGALGVLIKNAGDLISKDRGTFKLVLATNSANYLQQRSNVAYEWETAEDKIRKSIPNLEIITASELNGAFNGEDVFYLIYQYEGYGETLENIYCEMAHAYPIFTHHSEVSQKISQLVGGCIVKRPMFIARFGGINNETNEQNFNTYFN